MLLQFEARDFDPPPLNIPNTKTNRINRIDHLAPVEPDVSDVTIRLTRHNACEVDDKCETRVIRGLKGKHTPQRMGNFNGSIEYCYLQKVVGIVTVGGR
jgi:hypothetical protein